MAGVENLENVLGLGPNSAFDNALFPAQFPALLATTRQLASQLAEVIG
jgi:hypothetical protein